MAIRVKYLYEAIEPDDRLEMLDLILYDLKPIAICEALWRGVDEEDLKKVIEVLVEEDKQHELR